MACAQDLLQCLDGSCIYTCVPTPQQHIAATLLGDDLWLDNKFFPENIRRLSEAHSHTVNTLGEIGIKAFRAKVKTEIFRKLSTKTIYLLSSTSGWTLCMVRF